MPTAGGCSARCGTGSWRPHRCDRWLPTEKRDTVTPPSSPPPSTVTSQLKGSFALGSKVWRAAAWISPQAGNVAVGPTPRERQWLESVLTKCCSTSHYRPRSPCQKIPPVPYEVSITPLTHRRNRLGETSGNELIAPGCPGQSLYFSSYTLLLDPLHKSESSRCCEIKKDSVCARDKVLDPVQSVGKPRFPILYC